MSTFMKLFVQCIILKLCSQRKDDRMRNHKSHHVYGQYCCFSLWLILIGIICESCEYALREQTPVASLGPLQALSNTSMDAQLTTSDIQQLKEHFGVFLDCIGLHHSNFTLHSTSKNCTFEVLCNQHRKEFQVDNCANTSGFRLSALSRTKRSASPERSSINGEKCRGSQEKNREGQETIRRDQEKWKEEKARLRIEPKKRIKRIKRHANTNKAKDHRGAMTTKTSQSERRKTGNTLKKERENDTKIEAKMRNILEKKTKNVNRYKKEKAVIHTTKVKNNSGKKKRNAINSKTEGLSSIWSSWGTCTVEGVRTRVRASVQIDNDRETQSVKCESEAAESSLNGAVTAIVIVGILLLIVVAVTWYMLWKKIPKVDDKLAAKKTDTAMAQPVDASSQELLLQRPDHIESRNSYPKRYYED